MARTVKFLFRYCGAGGRVCGSNGLAVETRSAAGAYRPAAPSIAHARTAPARKTNLTDAEIERAIRAKFAASKIGADHFEAHVQGGVATLRGTHGRDPAQGNGNPPGENRGRFPGREPYPDQPGCTRQGHGQPGEGTAQGPSQTGRTTFGLRPGAIKDVIILYGRALQPMAIGIYNSYWPTPSCSRGLDPKSACTSVTSFYLVCVILFPAYSL